MCSDSSQFAARPDQCAALPPTPKPSELAPTPTQSPFPFAGPCAQSPCGTCFQRRNCVYCASATLDNGFIDWSRGVCENATRLVQCQTMTLLRSADQCTIMGRASRWNCSALAENKCVEECGGSAANVVSCSCETSVPKCTGAICNTLGRQACEQKCKSRGGVQMCDCSAYNAMPGADVVATCVELATSTQSRGIGGLAIFFIVLACLVCVAMVIAVWYAINRRRSAAVTHA